jgi:hypothetical protein
MVMVLMGVPVSLGLDPELGAEPPAAVVAELAAVLLLLLLVLLDPHAVSTSATMATATTRTTDLFFGDVCLDRRIPCLSMSVPLIPDCRIGRPAGHASRP